MADPPYNDKTARKMYGTELPSPIRLLEAGARVCKPGSLMFLLLGKPYQPCPSGVKRIGCIDTSVIPNNEVRFLNIYWKYEDAWLAATVHCMHSVHGVVKSVGITSNLRLILTIFYVRINLHNDMWSNIDCIKIR